MSVNQGGRPRKLQKGSTNQVRIDEDLALFVGWICEAKDVSTATLLSPMIREQVETLYVELFPLIQKIKAARDELARAKGQQPSEGLIEIHTDEATGQRSYRTGPTAGTIKSGKFYFESTAHAKKTNKKPKK